MIEDGARVVKASSITAIWLEDIIPTTAFSLLMALR